MSPRLFVLAAASAFVLSAPATSQADGSSISVSLDHARVLKIDEPAETIIIGNPSIVDVAIHDARTLILTGRSFGVTNFVVLDAGGNAIVDETVVVDAVETASVRVYRQANRSTYSCAPNCQPTMTVGDEDAGFTAAGAQFGAREARVSPAQQPQQAAPQ